MSEKQGPTPGEWEWDAGLIPPDGPGRFADIYTNEADGDVTIIAHFNDQIPGGIANAKLMVAAKDHALFVRSLLVGTARWEAFVGRSNDEGEVCVGGMRYSTNKDEFGVPILRGPAREALIKDLGERNPH